MIALIDYRAGNLTSVRKALATIGADVCVPTAPADLARASAIIVPGVGHFGATSALGPEWVEAILAALEEGRPLLGICLGMQWLYEGSEEAPDLKGLGVLSGRCLRLPGDEVRLKPDTTDGRRDVAPRPDVTDGPRDVGPRPDTTDGRRDVGPRPDVTDGPRDVGPRPDTTDGRRGVAPRPDVTDGPRDVGPRPDTTNGRRDVEPRPDTTDGRRDVGPRPDVTDGRYERIKIPHVGWNSLTITREAPIVAGVESGAQVYFTHSYVAPVTPHTVAVTEHGAPFAAVVQRGHVAGVQFHPEKSGEVGLTILRNFLAMCGDDQ